MMASSEPSVNETLVVTATYNEMESLPALVDEIRNHLPHHDHRTRRQAGSGFSHSPSDAARDR